MNIITPGPKRPIIARIALTAALAASVAACGTTAPDRPAKPGEPILVDTSTGPMQAILVSMDPPVAQPLAEDCTPYRFRLALDPGEAPARAEPCHPS